jgi:hypothetical protein
VSVNTVVARPPLLITPVSHTRTVMLLIAQALGRLLIESVWTHRIGQLFSTAMGSGKRPGPTFGPTRAGSVAACYPADCSAALLLLAPSVSS